MSCVSPRNKSRSCRRCAQSVGAAAAGPAGAGRARRGVGGLQRRHRGGVGVCVDTVRKWRKRFCDNGFKGLVDLPRSGRPRTFAAETVAQRLPLPRPARRRPHHPLSPTTATAHRRHLTLGPSHRYSLEPHPHRLHLATNRRPTDPKDPPALESPPTQRHRPSHVPKPHNHYPHTTDNNRLISTQNPG